MANHPQPGQAEPQPSDPWQDAPLWGGGPDATGAPYGEPSLHIADPYSPPTGYPAASPAPVWGPPTPPARKGLSTMAITAITAAAVVLVGGGIAGATQLLSDSGNSASRPPASHTNSPSASPSPTRSLSNDWDLSKAQIGDCVESRGKDYDHPDVHLVACSGPHDQYPTFRLVKKIEGTLDRSLCTGVPDATQSLYYTGTPQLVLCLHRIN